MSYPMRYIARFLLEAATPLAVGYGEKDILTDAPVALDCNGLPMIPGTGLCGVLRHALVKEYSNDQSTIKQINDLFGSPENDGGKGSRLAVSHAVLFGPEGAVIEGVSAIDEKTEFYNQFLTLPVRQHCNINAQGTANLEKKGKFDNQIVYKGSRFVFEMELIGDETDSQLWDEMLAVINSPVFRVGGGTRKGYGALKVIALKDDKYDLTQPDNLQKYLTRSSSLATSFDDDGTFAEGSPSKGFTSYKLALKPDDFFLFGSGFGDKGADITPVVETTIAWDGNTPEFDYNLPLIPASSIKGAISHRTAFHYNRLTKNYADKVKIESCTGEANEAVKEIFGYARGDGNDSGRQGRVMLSDMYLDLKTTNEKVLNHVAIDRFTQGTIDGALFSELVLAGGGFTIELLVEDIALEEEKIKSAFENTLTDITTGMLPLGGGVMRGHGVFNGDWTKEEANE